MISCEFDGSAFLTNESECLQAFLRLLFEARHNPYRIMTLFASVGLDDERLGSLHQKSDPITPYSRIVLSAEAECEVMLARWAVDRPCAPHDHGISAGWVFYLKGDFEEQSYHWKNGLLMGDETCRHPAGTFTQVHAGDIHSCVAPGGGLSLHVYFPRIARMKVFDLEAMRTVVVSDKCGAWLSEPDHYVEELAWAV